MSSWQASAGLGLTRASSSSTLTPSRWRRDPGFEDDGSEDEDDADAKRARRPSLLEKTAARLFRSRALPPTDPMQRAQSSPNIAFAMAAAAVIAEQDAASEALPGDDCRLVVTRDDDAYIEWIASQLCVATAVPSGNGSGEPLEWTCCEVWRAKGGLALNWSPLMRGSKTTQTRRHTAPASRPWTTALGVVASVARKRSCFSPMRAPRGHACARCLEVPLASFMRDAHSNTFAPGIGLVGRAWLRSVAEVVELAAAEKSSYARFEAARRAGLRVAVAVPIICRPRPARRDARPPGPVRTTAVVVVYFERPLRASASSISKVTLTFLESRFFL